MNCVSPPHKPTSTVLALKDVYSLYGFKKDFAKPEARSGDNRYISHHKYTPTEGREQGGGARDTLKCRGDGGVSHVTSGPM